MSLLCHYPPFCYFTFRAPCPPLLVSLPFAVMVGRLFHMFLFLRLCIGGPPSSVPFHHVRLFSATESTCCYLAFRAPCPPLHVSLPIPNRDVWAPLLHSSLLDDFSRRPSILVPISPCLAIHSSPAPLLLSHFQGLMPPSPCPTAFSRP